MALREIVYRLVYRREKRMPTLVTMTSGQLPDVRVETIAANLDDDGNVWRLVNVDGPEKDLRKIVHDLEKPPDGIDVRIISKARLHLVLWYKYSPNLKTRRMSLTHLAFKRLGREVVITDRAEGESLVVRILTPQTPKLGPFLKELEAIANEDFFFELLYVGPPRPIVPVQLDSDEEEMLAVARRHGYYDLPRRVSLQEIGTRLGCSASTASARLRRAEGKLIDAYLGKTAKP